ncbi:MAG: DUF551 domain-containing protein [Legionellaceae bacterium]|nr:DUF551 domain-containing protein [Legionellaceae bacterium]
MTKEEKELIRKLISAETRIVHLEKENERLKAEREWISVEDRLPEESGQVLGIMKDTFAIYVCHYSLSRKLFLVYGAGSDSISDMRVTHWMPLPSPPKQ